MNLLQGRTMRIAAMTAFILAAVSSAGAQDGAASVEGKAHVGMCVRKISGKVLADEGAEKNFMPASNLKLVTCGVALESLGADFRFQTTLAYSGKVGNDGVLRGDLHIVGGGDPTLGSSDPAATPRDSLFARWTRAVRAAGIRSVAGSVVGDSRRMSADVNGSWMYEDMATYYGASCSALMFNRNCIELTLRPGAEEGDPVHVEGAGETALLIPAEAPWMKIENRCVTGPSGSGDQSYLFVSEFATAARLGGGFALGKPAKSVSYNNPFADFSCAYAFALHLSGEGVPCKSVTSTSSCHPTATFRDSCAVFGFETFDTGGDLAYSGRLTPQDSLTTIAVTYSPRLSEIVRETLRVSDNLYSETLLRALTLANPSVPHLSAGTGEATECLKGMLGKLGLDLSGIRLDDGSGLSRKNSVSPAFMVRFLTEMSSRPCFGDFLDALNAPDPDEILFSASEAGTRRRIRLKSGSMTGVRCYSGYILPAASSSEVTSKSLQTGDITVFSIMVNDATLPQSALREYIELRLRPYLQ